MTYKDPEYQKKYRIKHKKEITIYEKKRNLLPKRKAQNKKYRISIKGNMTKNKWLNNHPEYYKGTSKKFRLKNPEYDKKWKKNNPEKMRLSNYKQNHSLKGKLRSEKYQKSQKGITYHKEYEKNNPRSRSTDYNLQDAMNNVRARDKNTCKWYKCGLTNRQAPIQVNHIFPKSEYPELKYEEKYMICYCLNHHIMFHYYRGDGYNKLLKTQIIGGVGLSL